MRREEQDRELVQQRRHRHHHPVAGPAPVRTALDGLEEQPGRERGAGRHQRVRPALLGVVAHEGGDGVQQSGPQAHPGAGEPTADRADEPRGDRGRHHGRQPEHHLVGAERQERVHQQVVQPVDGVDAAQQAPDVGQGTARHLEGGPLVAPHRAALQPPQAEGEHHGGGHDHRHEHREGPSPRACPAVGHRSRRAPRLRQHRRSSHLRPSPLGPATRRPRMPRLAILIG